MLVRREKMSMEIPKKMSSQFVWVGWVLAHTIMSIWILSLVFFWKMTTQITVCVHFGVCNRRRMSIQCITTHTYLLTSHMADSIDFSSWSRATESAGIASVEDAKDKGNRIWKMGKLQYSNWFIGDILLKCIHTYTVQCFVSLCSRHRGGDHIAFRTTAIVSFLVGIFFPLSICIRVLEFHSPEKSLCFAASFPQIAAPLQIYLCKHKPYIIWFILNKVSVFHNRERERASEGNTQITNVFINIMLSSMWFYVLDAPARRKKNACKILNKYTQFQINCHKFLLFLVRCGVVCTSVPFNSIPLTFVCRAAHSTQRTARTRFKHYDWNVFPVFNADMHLINYLTIMVVLKWHFDGYINIYVCIYYVCYAHLSNKILIWNVRDAIGCKHRNVQKQFFSTVNSSEE